MTERHYTVHVALAEHYLALGQPNVWLYRRYDDQVKVTDVDLPWGYVTEVKADRMRPVDISFTAPHPSGLVFHWSFYLQPRNDSGMQFDLARLNVMLQLLPSRVHQAFKAILLDVLRECDKDVESFRQLYVDRRDHTRAFRQLVDSIVEEN